MAEVRTPYRGSANRRHWLFDEYGRNLAFHVEALS